MARIICSICGWNVREQQTELRIGRTGHLKHAHGLAPYEGIVKDYFLHPWEVEETFNNKSQHSVNRVGKDGSKKPE